MLQDEEIAELGLGAEAEVCEKVGMRFVRFPLPDRGTPPSEMAVTALVIRLADELRTGRGVGIHCRMGIGRSASLAVCVLVVLGMPIDAAWTAVERARKLSIPDTPAQKKWVDDWHAKFYSQRSDR